MIFDVSHKTLYQYSLPVAQSQHVTHMTPRTTPLQIVRHHSMLVEPAPALRAESIDAFGNGMVILDVEVPHKELIVHARSSIEVKRPTAIDAAAGISWDLLDNAIRTANGDLDLETIQHRCASRFTPTSPAIADYAALSFVPGRPVLAAALDLTRRMFRDFTFDAAATDISTPIEHVLRLRRGVCQDFAHLALACLRSKRVPARYVSGYILTRPAPGQVKLQGADASHAWISVWSPEHGWRDFDPTNGIAVADEHITIAYGADYHDVAPITGVLLGGGEHTVSVAVDVIPVDA
jgi:transglutaminase-like putative cysteine protease